MNEITGPCEVAPSYGGSLQQLKGNTQSVLGSLIYKQEKLTRDLQDVTNAIEALNNNPEVSKLLELVNKASRI